MCWWKSCGSGKSVWGAVGVIELFANRDMGALWEILMQWCIPQFCHAINDQDSDVCLVWISGGIRCCMFCLFLFISCKNIPKSWSLFSTARACFLFLTSHCCSSSGVGHISQLFWRSTGMNLYSLMTEFNCWSMFGSWIHGTLMVDSMMLVCLWCLLIVTICSSCGPFLAVMVMLMVIQSLYTVVLNWKDFGWIGSLLTGGSLELQASWIFLLNYCAKAFITCRGINIVSQPLGLARYAAMTKN